MAVTPGQMNLRVQDGSDPLTAMATGEMLIADMTGETEAESYMQANTPNTTNGLMRLTGLSVAQDNTGLMRLTIDR